MIPSFEIIFRQYPQVIPKQSPGPDPGGAPGISHGDPPRGPADVPWGDHEILQGGPPGIPPGYPRGIPGGTLEDPQGAFQDRGIRDTKQTAHSHILFA